MSADVTDELLLQAGKRLEAAILPGQTFMDKSAGAFGALLAGTLLTLIAYPSAIDTAQMFEDALARLGLGNMISWLVLESIGIWLISMCDISRATLAAELAALQAAKTAGN